MSKLILRGFSSYTVIEVLFATNNFTVEGFMLLLWTNLGITGASAPVSIKKLYFGTPPNIFSQ